MRRHVEALKEGLGEGPAALSFNFLDRGDVLRDRIEKVTPLKGYQDYGIHSDGYTFTALGDRTGRKVTVEELAEWIRNDVELGDDAVRLLSCWAGKYEDGAAQQLANLLDREVMAPEAELYVNHLGEYNIARSKVESEMIFAGEIKEVLGWRRFFPEQL